MLLQRENTKRFLPVYLSLPLIATPSFAVPSLCRTLLRHSNLRTCIASHAESYAESCAEPLRFGCRLLTASSTLPQQSKPPNPCCVPRRVLC
ncbi:hypothetical protein FN846DRAFT_538605 [Sphaerosporella brunnea]|uniref:Uncharacterized protein n=1 Tax=Sphaerosporella brunnea TaxID=1250544 RepID=A0A5J5EDK6_9PEZI|nr:hypothetical protein FN846DRAFT_538605 [Sphaerosporella brunnea]